MEAVQMDKYRMAIEELALSGVIGIPGSARTVYRWARNINEILERENYGWRVRVDTKTCALRAVPMEGY